MNSAQSLDQRVDNLPAQAGRLLRVYILDMQRYLVDKNEIDAQLVLQCDEVLAVVGENAGKVRAEHYLELLDERMEETMSRGGGDDYPLTYASTFAYSLKCVIGDVSTKFVVGSYESFVSAHCERMGLKLCVIQVKELLHGQLMTLSDLLTDGGSSYESVRFLARRDSAIILAAMR